MSGVVEALEAHQQYISSGKLSSRLLRQSVFRAWERSHQQGASARRAKAIELEPYETERLVATEQYIIAAAKPYMRALSKAAGSDQHAAMLGDARAIVLDVLGDEQSVHGPLSVPGPGSLLDESACGANGIGTPLAEGGYVELVGPEHFIEGFHPFTCQGIPIRSVGGDIVAAISVSVKRPETGRRLREILICAAHGIEMELIRHRLENTVDHIATLPTPVFVENLRQDVVQALTSARLNVELAARSLGKPNPSDVSRLLELANRSMSIFRRQGILWRKIISTQTADDEDIDLFTLVQDLVSLLETERRTGTITLDTRGVVEPVVIRGDPYETPRALFRMFLRAFDVARGGGSVQVSIQRTFDHHGQVSLEAIPGPNQSGTKSLFTLARPLSTTLFLAE